MSKGRPLPTELRQRVMALLKQGKQHSHIAQQLMISRHTVRRYRDAAVEHHRTVPLPLPMGGFRHSAWNRDKLMQVAQLVRTYPKLTLKQIIHLATQRQIVSAPVSVTSMHRALQKVGLRHRRAVFFDERTHTATKIGHYVGVRGECTVSWIAYIG